MKNAILNIWNNRRYRSTFYQLLIIGFAIASAFSLRAADEIQELNRFEVTSQTPTVKLENVLMESIEPLGKIVSAYIPSSYLTNEDIVYLDFFQNSVSVGDTYSIYQDHGGVSIPNTTFTKKGHRVQIKGFLRITKIEKGTAIGKIFNATARIQRGDSVGPAVNLEFKLAPKEPDAMVRGRVIGGADEASMLGAFSFAFIDKGRKDGLQLNDRLYVYRSGDMQKEVNPNLPEINVAELVVVDLTEKFATAYVMSSSETFEHGSLFKSAKAEATYLK